jgi:hypothetical protein
VNPGPNRSTRAGRTYLDLQNQAPRTGRPTDELLQLYALEGFLDRLAVSPHTTQLVLKGGVLLAAFDVRRPTRDVDLQGVAVDNQQDQVLALVTQIAAITRDDGLSFDAVDASAEVIRDEDAYSGVRVTLRAQLASAQLTFHVDVNVGDPVWPAPQPVELPRLLGGHITVYGYPLPMVLAEKIITALHRGTANTRWRDFVDIYRLTRRHAVSAEELTGALSTVAEYRAVPLEPLTTVLDGYPAIAQTRRARWRIKQRLEDRVPAQFAELLAAVTSFADPLLSRTVSQAQWDPDRKQWR